MASRVTKVNCKREKTERGDVRWWLGIRGRGGVQGKRCGFVADESHRWLRRRVVGGRAKRRKRKKSSQQEKGEKHRGKSSCLIERRKWHMIKESEMG